MAVAPDNLLVSERGARGQIGFVQRGREVGGFTQILPGARVIVGLALRLAQPEQQPAP